MKPKKSCFVTSAFTHRSKLPQENCVLIATDDSHHIDCVFANCLYDDMQSFWNRAAIGDDSFELFLPGAAHLASQEIALDESLFHLFDDLLFGLNFIVERDGGERMLLRTTHGANFDHKASA